MALIPAACHSLILTLAKNLGSGWNPSELVRWPFPDDQRRAS
jgi:hypothetical protein